MFKLAKLRNELRLNKELGGIVNVLKGVASSEFYRLQKARKRLDEFGNYLRDFLQMVDITEFRHPFLEVSQKPSAILLITSDAGFLGKLNITVVNSALEQCSGNEKLVIVGKQGARLIEEVRPVRKGFSNGAGKSFTPRGVGFTSFPGISDKVDYEEAERLADFINKNFLDKKIGKTIVVYPQFLSFAVWKVQVYQLLPCRFLFREEQAEQEGRIIIEPSKTKIIEYLVKIWITYMLYGIFWESKLSEWAARVMHLEGSSYEIKQLDKKLRFQYLRILHEISDKNIREVFSGRLAAARVK